MTRLACMAVVACAACKPTPAPAPVPRVAAVPAVPIDASVVASVDAEPPPPVFEPPPKLGRRVAGSASCSAGDLGATGNPLPTRPLPDDCQARWDAIVDIESPRGKPRREHLVTMAGSRSLNAIETGSAQELAMLVDCPHAVQVDWTRDHVWVVTYDQEDGGVALGSIIDDGHVAVLGFHLGGRDGCGGAAPAWNHVFTLALVPANRAVALAECTSTEPPRHCTGLEK